MANITYDTVLFFWRVVTNIFFREIRPRGAWHIPKDGAVIFVAAPHSNQFLDPILLASEALREARRHVAFLIAAKSMRMKVIGFFAGLMGSIPTERAQDLAVNGSGFVSLSPSDPLLVIGVGTKFTTELSPRKKIALPKSTGSVMGEVVEVISDTEVKIKREFSGDNGKATSKVREQIEDALKGGKPGLSFKILPYVDQEQMYRHVYERLKKGGCIGIFPEGGSHDRTDLLPLKAGVSIMALGAMANNPGLRVRIVPVGLSYFHAHRFRSRAVVEFGSALDVPSELVEQFKAGGDSRRQASSKLLDIIYDALKTVTIRAPNYETLMLIQACRRLYKTPGQHLTLGQVVELNKRFIEGYNHFKDEPQVKKVQADVLRYNRFLKDLGLKDHQVPRAKRAIWKTLGLLTYRVLLLLIWTTAALPGVVLNSPIFIIAAVMSRKKAKEALAASSVKIAGRDVLASWKVLISLVFTPFLYTFYAVIATLATSRIGVSRRWRMWTPFITIAALPFFGYSALKFGEAGLDIAKSLRPLVIALLPGQQRSLNRLKAMREAISQEVNDVINEFGPKLFEDFDSFRILVPASAPPSSGSTGLWRRKTAVGGVDQQGTLLNHPMTWIDERLFGWSQSTRREPTSGSASLMTSHQGTPDVSDDEQENADYENVVGYLHSYEPSLSKKRTRSNHASYADLQQPRRNTSSSETPEESMPPSPVNENSPGRSRQRRSSLNDGVNVHRIAAQDPTSTFQENTASINQENQEQKQKHD
ncbi:glycerol-3-phosphate O-acyltransferase [Cantharellus anzutake]|uniref:glycerol-3-phosphate O-acyltransferase n=1 Tax=Cantharellus anzutake TaxID=1750568 RepID=UPI001906FAF9|nr:glycerol-3-phosphate O-acyltransferase [Cantharellus anzutake]KAF8326345.1 glycerol-3-phosphate O-acyltransferase [Cantharellus anzutake]